MLTKYSKEKNKINAVPVFRPIIIHCYDSFNRQLKNLYCLILDDLISHLIQISPFLHSEEVPTFFPLSNMFQKNVREAYVMNI